MKATAQAIDVARAAKTALERINASLEAASKRMQELKEHPEAKNTPRIQAAVAQISNAIEMSKVTAKHIRRIAFGAIALPQGSLVELSDHEIDVLSFGLDLE